MYVHCARACKKAYLVSPYQVPTIHTTACSKRRVKPLPRSSACTYRRHHSWRQSTLFPPFPVFPFLRQYIFFCRSNCRSFALILSLWPCTALKSLNGIYSTVLFNLPIDVDLPLCPTSYKVAACCNVLPIVKVNPLASAVFIVNSVMFSCFVSRHFPFCNIVG